MEANSRLFNNIEVSNRLQSELKQKANHKLPPPSSAKDLCSSKDYLHNISVCISEEQQATKKRCRQVQAARQIKSVALGPWQIARDASAAMPSKRWKLRQPLIMHGSPR